MYYKVSQPEPNFRKLLVCESADNELSRRYFLSNLVLLKTSLYLEYLADSYFGLQIMQLNPVHKNKQKNSELLQTCLLLTYLLQIEKNIFDRVFQHLIEKNLKSVRLSSQRFLHTLTYFLHINHVYINLFLAYINLFQLTMKYICLFCFQSVKRFLRYI